jgi:REP element-mobilizing transposase RayT
MGRPQREQIPGERYHVIARRVDRWPLFVDDDDYRRYVSLLAETVELCDWELLVFCLMPNHVHHLIRLRKPNLAKGMHRLHGMYVRHFNERHGRVGRLFEDRYRAEHVDDELYFLTAVEYIEMNPVKPALCPTPADWPWSSRGMLARGPCPPWLANGELERTLDAISDGRRSA